MREIIQDAHKHMDDGLGRAQAHNKKALRKRFYQSADVEKTDAGFLVTLDGRPTKTPGGKRIVLPSDKMAGLLVVEWENQKEFIDAGTMPVVRLINSAIEGGEAARNKILTEVMSFVGNDLLIYRAESPNELVTRQEQHWDAALDKICNHFDVSFEVVAGIIHRDQPETTLERLDKRLRPTKFIAATALMSLTGLMGSGLLAIALIDDLIDAECAWVAAHVDEDHNISLWGEDTEARARRQKRRYEFDAAIAVLELAKLS